MILKIKKLLFAGLIFSVGYNCFAQTPPPAQEIIRSQEMIADENDLRDRVEKGGKALINNIVIKGVTLVSLKSVQEKVEPFVGHWLSSKEFQQILDSVKDAYKDKGYLKRLDSIDFEIQKNTLEVRVKEKGKGG